ncbi:restriction endonuclease subunit S [Hydrogenophaga sp. R2]|uniref:restriction endonuclease subunit S n=1 Tax=Hydrogenophaga sp. R2 TaxID=3132827 RepID=UPI003CEE87EC
MSAVLEAREPIAKYLSALQPPLVQQFDLLATAPGGVTKLRELILALAVQGKLVPQDPNDEPAGELLKKIREEKDRLTAEGKIKRDKPLPEITADEKVFELPEGWERAKIGSLTNISTGKLDANAASPDGQYPFFTCSNTPLAIDRYSFDCSAVLLAGNGDFNLKHYKGKFDAYQRTYVIEPILLDLKFLYFSISHCIGELTKNKRGSAIPYLKMGDITNPPIPVPPLAEQARIVARVEELMRLCDALEAKGQLEATQHAQLMQTLLDALTASTSPQELADNWQRIATHFDILLDRPEAIAAMEQVILQLAVRGLLVPQDPKDEPASELLKKIRAEKDRLIAEGKIKRDKPLPSIAQDKRPFELPAGWEWVPLQHIGYTQTGTTPDKKNPDLYGSHIPFIKPGDIHPGDVDYGNEGLSELGLKDSGRTAPSGSILMVCIGTIGKTNIIDRDCSFNQQINSVTPIFCIPEFISLYLRCPYFQSEAWARSSSTTISILNKGKWEEIPLALPPLAEQCRIVAHVESLLRICSDLRERLAAIQTTQAHLAEALIDEVT